MFVRDSGLVHALLAIPDGDALLAHPIAGRSWEGFIIEQLLAIALPGVQGYFYRTGGGAEIDLLLTWPDGRTWAVEIKRSLQPMPGRGFHVACTDLEPARKFVVYPGRARFPLTADIEVLPVVDLMREVLAADRCAQ